MRCYDVTVLRYLEKRSGGIYLDYFVSYLDI